MPKIFLINDEWSELPWYSTGGTRAKKYLQGPDGKYYYFKRSQYKPPIDRRPGKDYRYEFWSEVIAYEVGVMLGFNVLKYDVAIYGDLMGCISASMIDNEEEELIEGVKYLQAFAPTYNPSEKEHQNRYTFQLIENSLEFAKIKSIIKDIIEIILFDSIIGNGDRHQENWAIIIKPKLTYELIDEFVKEPGFQKLQMFWKWLLKWASNTIKKEHEKIKKTGQKPRKYFYINDERASPIYDSGSSLGRELTDEKIIGLLNNESELIKYIDKGLAEIHWDNKKISHFDLVKKLIDSEYNDLVKNVINKVISNWNYKECERIIKEIDNDVPESHTLYKIPEHRKQLIFKIIYFRIQRLEALLNE